MRGAALQEEKPISNSIREEDLWLSFKPNGGQRAGASVEQNKTGKGAKAWLPWVL